MTSAQVQGSYLVTKQGRLLHFSVTVSVDVGDPQTRLERTRPGLHKWQGEEVGFIIFFHDTGA